MCSILQEAGLQKAPDQKNIKIKFDGVIFLLICIASRVMKTSPPTGFNEHRNTGLTENLKIALKCAQISFWCKLKRFRGLDMIFFEKFCKNKMG